MKWRCWTESLVVNYVRGILDEVFEVQQKQDVHHLLVDAHAMCRFKPSTQEPQAKYLRPD